MFKSSLQRIPIARFHVSFARATNQCAVPIKHNNNELWESSRLNLIKYIENNVDLSTSINPNVTIYKKDGSTCKRFPKLVQKYWNSFSTLNYLHNNISNTKNQSLLLTVNIDKFMVFIKQGWDSSIIRSLFKKELIYNSSNIKFINKLLSTLRTTTYNKPIAKSSDILQWCVDDSLSNNDIITAIDIFLLYYKINKSIDPPNLNDVKNLISKLKYQNPKYDNIHLKSLIQIYDLLESYNLPLKLSDFEVLMFCNKALSPDMDPIISKTILTVLLDSQSTLSSKLIGPTGNERLNQINIGYATIDRDYKIRNPTGIYLTWIQIKDLYSSFSDHDSRILYKVFKSCSQNRTYRIICVEMLSKMKPSHYCNDPLLLPIIIKYITLTKSLKNAQHLMTNMEKYTTIENKKLIWSSKRFLSSLLKMQLCFFDAGSVDNIIKQIIGTYGSLSSADYQAIVSHLLEKPKMDNIKRALKFVDSIPLDQRFSSYSVLVNKLIESIFAMESKMKLLVMPLINEILIKAHTQDPHHDNPFWSLISALYIKSLLFPLTSRIPYLSQKNSSSRLDMAKLLYCKSDEFPFLYNSNTSINPFSEPHPKNIKLKITNMNRFVILRNIAHTALKCSRKDIFLWACSKLYKGGMPIEELILLWNITYKHQIRNTKFQSKKEIIQCIEKYGSKAFKIMLQ
ncbi:hypothetical protein RI543_000669 [Arxiozyma heterogenica]|uniref:Uncharacterized protein n=1 Tax=Arxiozyma heterogenica TaxID=278026 RepID=A0AAN7WK34_9SACH|nr:hypothetical protein RI543_000669 [Kazachstania heterogenica]